VYFSNLIYITTELIEDKQVENMELSRIVNESNDNSNNGNNNNNNNNDNNDTDALDNRILMKEIIKIAKDGKIEEVYHDVNKYFLFHRLCVMNVLFKTKWKKID